MKTRGLLMITLILIFLSGCIETKVYLGREDQEDEQEQVYGAINPTTIPAGITWGTFRSYINENFKEVDLAIDTLDNGLADAVDSISAHRTAINLRLLKSDTASMLANYTRNGELATALAVKVNVSDTAAMLAHYALTSEIGDGGDSTVYATRYYAESTFAPIANPTFTGIQKVSTTDTLATQAYARSYGGTGTVTIEDVRNEIADSLNTRIGAGIELSDVAVMIADSTGNAPGNYVTRKALMDSLLLRSEPIFVFGAGGGNPGDTAIFSGSGFPVLGSFNTGRDTVMITQVVGQLWNINTTDTLAIQIMYADTLNQTSFTTVWSTAIGINVDGLNSTSFANPKIPPRKWVWSRVSSVIIGRKPTMVNIQPNGYRIKAY